MGYETPTPIQAQAIPVIRSGQHVIGIAQTGTGKTAAYLLPILSVLRYAQGDQPRAIVLVPTKELVLQIQSHAKALAANTTLRIAGFYGGVGRKKQAEQFSEAGVDLIVSTPRRLMEMYEEERLGLKKVQFLVLDEADRMLDMGFLPQINLLLDILPRKRQNLLFSATFSPKVEELSWNFMDFPHKIEIAPEATPVETVSQWQYEVPNFQTKLDLLCHLLKDEEDFHRVMVFVKTKKSATEIFEYLQGRIKGKMQLIHSNKSQNTRINAFNAFKDGELRILITTDVMARGIDIPKVSHVVNFDVPMVHEDYVHRIGRTGRAHCTGSAITFVNKADEYHREKIEKKIRMSIPKAEWPEAVEIQPTPFEEEQEMLRAIDEQKRKDDPTFQGAFHEKKDHRVKQKEKSDKKKFRQANKTKNKSFYKKDKPKSSKTSKHRRS
jgi:ATP-dependent RNA helicase RhlE